VQCVATTDEKLRANKNVTGWPKLEEYLGQHGRAVVSTLTGWLNIVIGGDWKVKVGGNSSPQSPSP
jgi:hypothetical protein